MSGSLPDLSSGEQRRLPHLTYADVRVEVVEVTMRSRARVLGVRACADP